MATTRKIKKAALLFTGGKDSCLALLKAKHMGYSVKCLLTVLPSTYDSWMFHKPSLNLLNAQAKALDLPLITKKSAGKKESELKDLDILIKKVAGKVDSIITGGVASTYQTKRIKKIAKKYDLDVVMPLWRMAAEQVWKECLKNKFEVILTKISCEGIDASWLGKIINEQKLEQLSALSKKYKFSLEFEGGDAETSVLSMPLFKHNIKINGKVKSESEYRHFLIIRSIGKK